MLPHMLCYTPAVEINESKYDIANGIGSSIPFVWGSNMLDSSCSHIVT